MAYPLTIPGVLAHTGPAYWLAEGIAEDALARLVQELPLHRTLTFYDPTFPSPSDPGAYVTLWWQDKALWYKQANHGWHTNAAQIPFEDALQLLLFCAPCHAPGNPDNAYLLMGTGR